MIDSTTVFFILQNLSGYADTAIYRSLFFPSGSPYVKNKRFKKGNTNNKDKPLNVWPETQAWRTAANDVEGAKLRLAQEDEALLNKEQPFYDEPDWAKTGENARYCFTSHAYNVLLDYGKRFNKDDKIVCEKVLALLKEFQVPEEQYNKAVEATNKGKFSDLAYYIIDNAKDAVNSTNREPQFFIYERYKELEQGAVAAVDCDAEPHETPTPISEHSDTETEDAPKPPYRILSAHDLMAEGFSEHSLADYLSVMYEVQRCIAEQPMERMLHSPLTWAHLLRNPENFFYLVVEQLNSTSADGTQKPLEESIAPVGFFWVKKYYTDGRLDYRMRWADMEWSGSDVFGAPPRGDAVPRETMAPSAEERLAQAESVTNALCILGSSLPKQERVHLAHQFLSTAVFQLLKDEAGISHILVRALSADEECFWQEVGFTRLKEDFEDANWTPCEAALPDTVYGVIMGMCTDHICSPLSGLTAHSLFHQNCFYLLTSTYTSIKMLLTGSFGFTEVEEEYKTIFNDIISGDGENNICLHIWNSSDTDETISTEVTLASTPPLEYVSIRLESESGPYQLADSDHEASVNALIAKLKFKLKDRLILQKGRNSFCVSYRTDLFLESPAELETLKDLIQGHFDMVSSAYSELACITDSPKKML